jgi:alkanesulfonate monooxygenase SsuD/methylene tetrahydromethanopterin reductase-like flavin-dependent oxidoreductase (luciferase family)
MSDCEAWNQDIRLTRLADELGYDVIWLVEHHLFDYFDYSFCPLDLLSNGSVRLGLGSRLRRRGLARREFVLFGGMMDDSHERFDETSMMVMGALRSGFIEEHGRDRRKPR